ncbi:4Fe-4S single cluster domain-containing protein [Paraliomyxa miuraensis]|uniref:4Fe-4S single cluster domain-containing protein n=1 Tax=Paraliomyxa miuraensis TaxID=376150 RepID=UPI00225BC31A|nr:4Fe-4S single cluster domain-containing protein [Paraliomyxa miuraensis]MCX4242519.1 radical SAM protein [Paraliomyxa miuraensis]
MRLNLANTLRRSAANGPGERFVVWVQGCPLACPGCWNPDTWSFDPRRMVEVNAMAEEILAVQGIEGVTFTGGEPFIQGRALASLGRIVQDAGLSVLVFTGFERAELVGHARQELLEVTDVLVTGRYSQAQRTTEQPWRGSSNQQVWFLTERYSASDLGHTATAEVHLAADGSVLLTGFPPDALRAGEATS